MPGQPPIQPFHRRDPSLLSTGLSCTDTAATLFRAGFIIHMGHYNGLHSNSICMAACSKLGLPPVNFKSPTKIVSMMHTNKRNSSGYGDTLKHNFSKKTKQNQKKHKYQCASMCISTWRNIETMMEVNDLPKVIGLLEIY